MSTTYLLHRLCTRFALFAFAPFIILLIAWGSPVSVNVTTSPVPNPNLLAVLPELQKSPQAMQQVQTAHVDRQGKETIQTSGALLPAFTRQTRYKTQ